LALALKAREDGDTQLSEHIVAAALQCEEKAKALEAAAAKPKEELAAVGQLALAPATDLRFLYRKVTDAVNCDASERGQKTASCTLRGQAGHARILTRLYGI